jgi:peptidase M66-like protein
VQRKALRTVRGLLLAPLVLLAACGGGDAPTGGNSATPKSASLTVTVANLPSTITANVTVSGPNGFSSAIVGTTTLTGLTPGSYVVTAKVVETETAVYAAVPTSQNVELAAGSSRSVDVTYGLASGAIDLVVSGLPAGSVAVVTVSGPNNYSHITTASETLVKLAPGSYVIAAATVTIAGDGYAAATAPRTVDVTATLSPHEVAVSYLITTGRLLVKANGLPSGATPTFQVTGPNGFSQTAVADQVLTGLAPGMYTIGSPNVTVGGTTYIPAAGSLPVAVGASAVAAQATVAYALFGGSLSISVAGLPAASISVQGPSGYSTTIATTSTLSGLTPGTYTIVAAPIMQGVHRYTGSPATQSVTVAASGTTNATVTYAVSTGSLSFSLNGLLSGMSGNVRVTGPGGYAQTLTAAQVLATLTPGQYVLEGRAVTFLGGCFSPQPVTQTITVPASVNAVAATVTYTNSLGAAAISVVGLPSGAQGRIALIGALGVVDSVTATDTVPSLAPGFYAVTASTVTANGITYTPSQVSQPLTVTAGALSTLGVTYVPGAGSGPVNLTIDNVYVTQAVQTYVGDVPLVAGRDGLVRVFVKANTANTAQPQVRVRLYNGSTQLSTLTLSAPMSSVPTSPDDATLTSAWYGTISGSLIQPNLRILADVDPSNAITEASESDNTWPGSGTAATMFVKTVSTFSVRFVPIKQSNDNTGNVTTSNAATLLNDVRRMYPVNVIAADVRATYTTSAGILQANDNNGAWTTLLSEINALRAADGSSRYYYGVVKTAYSSGIAGLGYVGAPTAIGWDLLPSASDVLAHELGHNFGRYHSPCGGAASTDPAYPYASGRIGVSGYDLTTSQFKLSTTADVMGYCSPDWVSDYTYKGIMTYRETHPIVASATSARAAEPGLLVWGHISGSGIVLEPAFEVVAPVRLPSQRGANRIEGLADDGSVLFSLAFEGDAVDHARPQDRHFAFVVPQSAWQGRALGTLRLVANGQTAELRSTPASAGSLGAQGAQSPLVRRSTANAARLTWSDPAVRGVLVRDAQTGDVLAIARGGDAKLETTSPDVELVISDGVRSRARRVTFR